MNTFRVALVLAVLVIVPGAAMAQSEGAIVTRGQDAYDIAWVEYDGATTLLVYSNYPDFACNSSEPVLLRWQTVLTPVGARHYHDHGLNFARLYQVDEAALNAFDEDPHEFLCGGDYHAWAEGALQTMFYDSQADPAAPGANVWGHVLNGMLTDLGGACKSGLVKVEVVHMLRLAPNADYPACAPGCVELRAFKGPTATCVGKK